MSHPILTAIIAICMLTAPSTLADQLVTRDGSVIETKGPWKVKGRQIVFTSSKGVLSSMRIDDVDLEASEEATRKALEPPAPAEAAPSAEAGAEATPEPALVITNKNLWRVSRASDRDDAVAAATELGRGMAEGMAGMGSALGGGGADGDEIAQTIHDGLDPAFEEFGEKMAEGMAKAVDFMAEIVGVMTLLAPQIATLEAQYDLDTPEGIQAAAPGLEGLARSIRDQIPGLSPEAAEMLGGMADQMDEVAKLARTNPEEAMRKRQQIN